MGGLERLFLEAKLKGRIGMPESIAWKPAKAEWKSESSARCGSCECLKGSNPRLGRSLSRDGKGGALRQARRRSPGRLP